MALGFLQGSRAFAPPLWLLPASISDFHFSCMGFSYLHIVGQDYTRAWAVASSVSHLRWDSCRAAGLLEYLCGSADFAHAASDAFTSSLAIFSVMESIRDCS